jgi:hypothetical protein
MKRKSSESRYSGLAAKMLAGAAAPPSVGGTIGDRPAVMAALGRALRARRWRRRLWISGGLAGTAAVALFGILWLATRESELAPRRSPVRGAQASALTVTRVEGSGASVVTSGGAVAAAPGVRIAAGAAVQAAGNGDLVATLETGTRVRLAAGGRVRLLELEDVQRFSLESGALDAKVAKLAVGHRFLVETPDAEVEVRGTEFEITIGEPSPACAPDVRTHVAVREGTVTVRHGGTETQVAAGGVWPSCASQAVTVAAPLPAPSPSPVAKARAHRAVAAPVPAGAEKAPDPAARPASTLAEQNDLFAAALAARRRGDVEEALRWLERLLERYPNGQLVGTARAEQRRLLEDPRGARRPE